MRCGAARFLFNVLSIKKITFMTKPVIVHDTNLKQSYNKTFVTCA